MPVAQSPRQQRPGQHDAPGTVFPADADIDELRVEHNLAETLLHRLHRRLRITRPGQADRLHIDHRVRGSRQCLLQVTDTTGRQHQTRIGCKWRQLLRGLPRTTLHLAAVGIDRLDQLRLLGRGCRGG